MASKKALVLTAGQLQQLQAGDVLEGLDTTLLLFDNSGVVPPNAMVLVAGPNVTFDDSVPGILEISATGGGGGGTGNTFQPSGW